ncbi:MAG: DUF1501 domain-containing protein [Solirubrobacteraceae bacterium]|jgi:uncharacterized protein (DUF1501 family)
MKQPTTCACQEFNRADLLRRGVAQAGRGLPSIEHGMPLPAGTGLSRRSFMLSSAGALLTVYGAGRLLEPSAFQAGIAQAAPIAGGRVIVSIYLQGGIDSMSVLLPVGDPLFGQYRPTLGLAEGAGPTFTEDTQLMWHPLAAPIAQLHAEGKVIAMPTVGYTDPMNQSHFTSRHYYEVGALDANLLTGWLGRYLDVVGTPNNPLQGLCLDDSLQPSLGTAKVPVATIDLPSDYSFWAEGVWGPPQTIMYSAFDSLGQVGIHSGDPAMYQSGDAAVQSNTLRQQLLPFQPQPNAPTPTLPPNYPTASDDFPARLAAVAAMLGAGFPISAVAVSTESVFDTHESQESQFTQGFGEAMQSIYAFQRDIEARGLADRVLTLVWSEFGRRPQENASDGTDHGAAGIGFVIGTSATGTMVGEWQGLKSGLDPLGNLTETVDYRSVYCSLLEQWLAQDAAQIIPNAAKFPRVAVVR